jgi:DNA-binding MarR family transcriptional regulator
MTTAVPTAPIGGLGLLLDRVAASLLKEFEDALAPWELRNLHLGVLSTIEQFGPLAQIRIGEYLGIERQTMANLIDDLEGRGLVERQKVPSDRRVWAVAITRKGKDARKQAASAGAVRAVELFAPLSEHERATLTAALMKLASAGRYPNLFVQPET